MKKSGLAVALVLAAACAKPQYRAPGAEVVLTVDGRVRGAPVEFDAAALAAMKRRTVRGRDPRAGVERTYEGTSLLALVRKLEPRNGTDLVVLHGSDGYTVAIPLPAVRQYRPVLAEQADGRPVAELGGGRFMLAWPNADAPGFDEDARTRWWWPRDVRRIELVSWFQSYGRALRVPPGASDLARQGADAFAASCIHCHRLRNAGGSRGPDLSSGVKPGGRDEFAAVVREHPARVPGLTPSDVTRRLPEIAAFLEAVESAGPPLAGDEPPPEPQEDDEEQAVPGPATPPVPPFSPLGRR